MPSTAQRKNENHKPNVPLTEKRTDQFRWRSIQSRLVLGAQRVGSKRIPLIAAACPEEPERRKTRQGSSEYETKEEMTDLDPGVEEVNSLGNLKVASRSIVQRLEVRKTLLSV